MLMTMMIIINKIGFIFSQKEKKIDPQNNDNHHDHHYSINTKEVKKWRKSFSKISIIVCFRKKKSNCRRKKNQFDEWKKKPINRTDIGYMDLFCFFLIRCRISSIDRYDQSFNDRLINLLWIDERIWLDFSPLEFLWEQQQKKITFIFSLPHPPFCQSMIFFYIYNKWRMD